MVQIPSEKQRAQEQNGKKKCVTFNYTTEFVPNEFLFNLYRIKHLAYCLLWVGRRRFTERERAVDANGSREALQGYVKNLRDHPIHMQYLGRMFLYFKFKKKCVLLSSPSLVVCAICQYLLIIKSSLQLIDNANAFLRSRAEYHNIYANHETIQ